MGADLYLGNECDIASRYVKPLFDKAVKLRDRFEKGSKEEAVAQEMVSECYEAMYPEESYFRDSYNSTGVLQTLGLSWWTDCGALLNKSRNLSGENLVKFRDMVEKAKQELPTKEELTGRHASVDDGENSLETWHKYYTEKRQRLINFLNTAIQKRKPIRCSI